MQVVLVMFRSDGERRSFSIVRDVTVIGRREDSDLRIPLGDVSRKHCRLIKSDDTLKVEDLGSSNGTHVNGQRVQEADLNPGDMVQVGPVTFVVQIDGVPADDQLQPAAAPDDTAVVPGEALAAEAAGEEIDGGAGASEDPVALGADDLAAVLANDDSLDGEAPALPENFDEEEASVRPAAPKAPAKAGKSAPKAAPSLNAVDAEPEVVDSSAGAQPPAEEDADFDFIVDEGRAGESDVDIDVDFGAADDLDASQNQQSHHG